MEFAQQEIRREGLRFGTEQVISDDITLTVDPQGAGYKARIIVGLGVGRRLAGKRRIASRRKKRLTEGDKKD